MGLLFPALPLANSLDLSKLSEKLAHTIQQTLPIFVRIQCGSAAGIKEVTNSKRSKKLLLAIPLEKSFMDLGRWSKEALA